MMHQHRVFGLPHHSVLLPADVSGDLAQRLPESIDATQPVLHLFSATRLRETSTHHNRMRIPYNPLQRGRDGLFGYGGSQRALPQLLVPCESSSTHLSMCYPKNPLSFCELAHLKFTAHVNRSMLEIWTALSPLVTSLGLSRLSRLTSTRRCLSSYRLHTNMVNKLLCNNCLTSMAASSDGAGYGAPIGATLNDLQ